MINRHTDRTDIYFVSTYISGSDSEHHLMNQLFRQKGSGTGTYEKKVGRPRWRPVGGFAVYCFRHISSLSLCSWGEGKTLKNPLLKKRRVCKRSPSHVRNHMLSFYSPLEISKPNHLVRVPNLKERKDDPGHKWTMFPNFLAIHL